MYVAVCRNRSDSDGIIPSRLSRRSVASTTPSGLPAWGPRSALVLTRWVRRAPRAQSSKLSSAKPFKVISNGSRPTIHRNHPATLSRLVRIDSCRNHDVAACRLCFQTRGEIHGRAKIVEPIIQRHAMQGPACNPLSASTASCRPAENPVAAALAASRARRLPAGETQPSRHRQ